MKTLFLIGGTMGVGKTSISQQLKRMLPHAVFLDGDWCWDADPFVVTEETRRMVMDNICHTLNNFINCSAYENIIFCWVMHEQSIIDEILSQLALTDVTVHAVSLVCNEQTLRERLGHDIEQGKRSVDVIERSVARLPLYDALSTIRIETDGISPTGVAKTVIEKMPV